MTTKKATAKAPKKAPKKAPNKAPNKATAKAPRKAKGKTPTKGKAPMKAKGKPARRSTAETVAVFPVAPVQPVDVVLPTVAAPVATSTPTIKTSTMPTTKTSATPTKTPTPPTKTPTTPTATTTTVVSSVRVDLADHGVVRLKPGKERPVVRRHPWIFSGAIHNVEGDPQSGDVVVVVDSHGEVLGRGAYSPLSQLRVRMWSFDDAPLTPSFITAALDRAAVLRDAQVFSQATGDETDGARLVFGEGDGLPGLIVDVYADTAVMQCQSAGAERIKPLVVQWLIGTRKVARVVDRGDADVRKKEGLPITKGILHGTTPTAPIVTREHGLKMLVDVEGGHKTGFYLDQRDSRHTLRGLARGKTVLNCFCYTGGFSVAALAGGATHVTSVDTSQPALELGQQNAFANGFADELHDWLKGDCFDVLNGLRDDGQRYDVVILDPPKFAPSAQHLEKAARGYRELMMRGLEVTKPGGFLLTFSCSGAVDRSYFRQLLLEASLNVGRDVQILAELGHSRCHPVAVTFPEGEYLKGLLARVI